MQVLLALYAIGCVQALSLSKRAQVSIGVAVAVAALMANLVGLALGGYSRGWIAPAILVLAAVATKAAFTKADASIRDTDEERSAFRAARALLAMTLGEAMLALVSGFVWLVD